MLVKQIKIMKLEVTTVTNIPEMQSHSVVSKILTSNEDHNNNMIEKGNSK